MVADLKILNAYGCAATEAARLAEPTSDRLRLPEVREAQAALAREYGIHGFCYYHYWFNGRRILEGRLPRFYRRVNQSSRSASARRMKTGLASGTVAPNRFCCSSITAPKTILHIFAR